MAGVIRLPARTPSPRHHKHVDDILSRKAPAPSRQWTNVLLPSDQHMPTKTRYMIHFLSCLPLFIATGVASGATGAPPTHFNLRHAVLLGGVLGCAVASRIAGIACERWFLKKRDSDSESSSGRTKLAVILIFKNIVLGLLPVVLLGLLTCGVFSGCAAWKPITISGDAGIDLLPLKWFANNIRYLYPPLVGSGLALQLGFVVLVVYGFRFLDLKGTDRGIRVEVVEEVVRVEGSV